jgi:hypothetical protein
MKQTMVVIALAALTSAIACAGDAPMSVPLNPQQAQARQFGIYLGGTASTYDLCVRRGFLPKIDPSAEETAKAIIERMRASNKGSDPSSYVQEGWDMMKNEIAENESFFTQEKCSFAGKEWAKIIVMMKKK